MNYERNDTQGAAEQGQARPASGSGSGVPVAAPLEGWRPLSLGSQPGGGAHHAFHRHHARYESTDSSIYDSSWFSDSPSVFSPTSPETGYYSAGDASDFSGNPGVWSPRSSIGYPQVGNLLRQQVPLTLDPSKLSSLHLSSTAGDLQAPTTTVATEGNEDQDAEGEEEEMSGDESEYLESKKISPRRKGKRPIKVDEVKKEETESDFADMRATSAARASRIRASRLNSERKRRDALSNAFADIRSMLPPDVQKMTKSRILEEAAIALREAKEEAAHWKQLCQVMQQRQAAFDAGQQPIFPDSRRGGTAAGPSRFPGH